MKKRFVKVCSLKDVPSGRMKVFNMHLIEFLVYNKKGKVHAVYNKCPHMGGSLADGEIDKKGYITCPLHGWQFDPETGKGPEGYNDSIKVFETKIRMGNILINESELIALAQDKRFQVPFKHNSKERYERAHDKDRRYDEVHIKSKFGGDSIVAMGSLKPFPKFESIHFNAAQLSRLPLLPKEKVNLKTVIGKTAKKPMTIQLPFFVSHMSFGALSKETKIALATGAKKMGTAMCSGEGGRHPDEFKNAGKYIYEIGTACFTRKKEWVTQADAIEIKIGQSAKPGLGGHLPKEKITKEIAELRGIPRDKDQISPARFPDFSNKKELKSFVSKIRKQSGGKPIGIKFAASGALEKDLDVALFAKPDFITIDGFGGGTAAAPTFIKDNFAMPIVYAIPRARKHLDKKKSKVSLIATGGLRTSGEITKALAMGADAVALATASLIAVGCQQYRTCHTGNCPVGITTHNPELRKRFNIKQSVQKFVNYYSTLKHEVSEICQAIGKNDVHKLNYSDLVTTDENISRNTSIKHA